MRTWLDRWVVKQFGPKGDILSRAKEFVADVPRGDDPLAEWRLTLKPYFSSSATDQRPCAFKLEPGLANALGSASCADEVRDFGAQEALLRRLVYLDIPEQSVMVGAARWLRAVFFSSIPPKVRLTAVVRSEDGTSEIFPFCHEPTVLDEDAAAAFLELLGTAFPKGSVGAEVYARDMVDRDVDRSMDLSSASQPPKADEGFRYSHQDISSRARDLLFTVMAYVATSSNSEEVNLPYLASSDPRRHARKAPQLAKKFSLFRVRELRADSHMRLQIRAVRNHQSTLAHRVEVRGHFRLQPYGHGRSLRRLNWIAPHVRGPIDVPGPLLLARVG